MYQSGCTETVHIMSVQCTEVVHLYVLKWSYRSGPPHVPKWSCTELVLPPWKTCIKSILSEEPFDLQAVNYNGGVVEFGTSWWLDQLMASM